MSLQLSFDHLSECRLYVGCFGHKTLEDLSTGILLCMQPCRNRWYSFACACRWYYFNYKTGRGPRYRHTDAPHLLQVVVVFTYMRSRRCDVRVIALCVTFTCAFFMTGAIAGASYE
ncbi:hypothetical protein J6590_004954 [Homalodisca vitripennis]|nr:hypothetical protein J6590_004954 [Homalodisca vitripennis]